MSGRPLKKRRTTGQSLAALRREIAQLRATIKAHGETLHDTIIWTWHHSASPFTILDPRTGRRVARITEHDGSGVLILYGPDQFPRVFVDADVVTVAPPPPDWFTPVVPNPPTVGPHGLN
jgi:hypothetical protein